jgi:hypothetical protein
MTAFIASNRVSIYRGTSVDAYDDEIDDNSLPVHGLTGLPVSISEDRQRKFRPAEQRGTLVEQYTIRFRPGVAVYESDRVIDDDDFTIYQVTDVSNPKTMVGLADVRVSAFRVGNLSRPVNG